MNIWRTLPALATLLLLGACGGGQRVAGTENKVEAVVRIPRAVNEVEKVVIGGVETRLCMRGLRKSNPVLLFLHGGPGYPEAPQAHAYGAGLEEEFIVVHWDQRGAGMGYNGGIPESSMTIERFVRDIKEVTEYLRTRFGVGKIVLVGHSWGSVIGLHAVKRHPALFHAYVGIGQVVNVHQGEEISYKWTLEMARQTENHAAVRALEALGRPPYGNLGAQLRGITIQRRWLTKFGGNLYGERGFGKLKAIHKKAPRPYRVPVKKLTGGLKFSFRVLWPKVAAVDMFTQVRSVQVPVFFLSGRLDYTTPFELVERYHAFVDAPRGKRMVWFYSSAHWPHVEEPDKFVRTLVDDVRPLIK